MNFYVFQNCQNDYIDIKFVIPPLIFSLSSGEDVIHSVSNSSADAKLWSELACYLQCLPGVHLSLLDVRLREDHTIKWLHAIRGWCMCEGVVFITVKYASSRPTSPVTQKSFPFRHHQGSSDTPCTAQVEGRVPERTWSENTHGYPTWERLPDTYLMKSSLIAQLIRQETQRPLQQLLI